MDYLHRHPHGHLIKYFLAGGVVVAVNLSVLYALTEFAHVYYLLSAVCAFFVSFAVSYVLQKFWTFRDRKTTGAMTQMGSYLLLQASNVALNLALLYIFVQYFHVWYLFAQVIIAVILALCTFYVSKFYIFTAQ